MEPDWLSPLSITVAALTTLGALVFLRVLATAREQLIDAHDLAREARRLRTEYDKRRGAER